jgi:serine/threonine protein kinase
MAFMSPELLIPSKFGRKDSVPTPEADIYAFGFVVFQVCEQGHNCQLFCVYFVQVLTGEIPFRGVRKTELGYSIVEGKRPDKPANASAIGFSDLLWGFVQRCWDGDMNVRPKAAEVVTHLENAAASWVGLMQPCLQAENVVSGPLEPTSDSMERCEFEILGSLDITIEQRYRCNLQIANCLWTVQSPKHTIQSVGGHYHTFQGAVTGVSALCSAADAQHVIPESRGVQLTSPLPHFRLNHLGCRASGAKVGSASTTPTCALGESRTSQTAPTSRYLPFRRSPGLTYMTDE